MASTSAACKASIVPGHSCSMLCHRGACCPRQGRPTLPKGCWVPLCHGASTYGKPMVGRDLPAQPPMPA
eukprot:7034727-Alexandrium_andersonii.AAC.1